MSANVASVAVLMERLAPAFLAEEWDNAGLQVGRPDWPVQRVLVALDATPDVVTAACRERADLLITHHPLIFKPLRSVDLNTAIGGVIGKAIRHKLAVFAAHTNLDKAAGGVNDVLAGRIGLKNLSVLAAAAGQEKVKLAVYVPLAYEKTVLTAFHASGAGTIGAYSNCTFRSRGKGTFRPGPGATPFSGTVGEVHTADEIRIEAVVERPKLPGILAQIASRHPYETMAYDVFPLVSDDAGQGLGRVGELERPVTLEVFADQVRERLKLKYLRVAGKPDLPVSRAAVCSGSGSGLLSGFYASGAQAYVSGDLHYHDARDVEAAGLGLIDVGHFASEHLIVEDLAERLRALAAAERLAVDIRACRIENDPFRVV